MKIRMGTVLAGLFTLAVWSDDPFAKAPVPEVLVAGPLPPEIDVRPKVHLPALEVGSAGVIVPPLAVLRNQSWQLSAPIGSPNRDWQVGDDEYIYPWAEEGDRLIVLADADDDSDPERLVHARMETGRYAGRIYKIERKAIAAAK